MKSYLKPYSFASLFAIVALNSFAQKNYIDVPAEVTEAGKLFAQEQATITGQNVNTSTVLSYGLKHDFEIGINLYQFSFSDQGLATDPAHPENEPDFLIAAQKLFKVTEDFGLSIGTRSGVNIARSSEDLRFVNFDYVNSHLTVGAREHKFSLGAYYGNYAYLSDGPNFGVMGGADINMIKDKVHFVADFFSGTSSISVASGGIEFELPHEWKIAFGAQLPMPSSANDPGGFIQISKN